VFPAKGDFTVWLWKRGAKKPVEKNPDDPAVKTDYLFIRRQLLEQGHLKPAKGEAAAPSGESALQCTCRAPVKPNDVSCASCGQRFDQAIAIDKLPGNANKLAMARSRLAEVGLRDPASKDWRTFVLFKPRGAAQWLTTREVFARAGCQFLEEKELGRRRAVLAAAKEIPRRYPVGAAKTLAAWLNAIFLQPPRDARGSLEALAASEAGLLEELVLGLRAEEAGWTAAMRAEDLDPVKLWRVAPIAFSVPLLMAGVDTRKLRLSARDSDTALYSVSWVAPDRLPEKYRRQMLAEARKSAGDWIAARHRLEATPLPEAIADGLQFEDFAQKVIGWAAKGEEPPWIFGLEERAVAAALRELKAKGFPPAFAKRLEAVRSAEPPYGLKARPAWALAPQPAKGTEQVRCHGCRKNIPALFELRVPEIEGELGARTLRIFECPDCAAEEPIPEYVQLRVEAGAQEAPAPAGRWSEYPDEYVAKRLNPDGFQLERYQKFLEAQGKHPKPDVKLGGYPSNADDQTLEIRLRCKHPPTLLTLLPYRLGLKVTNPVSTGLCTVPGCKRPGFIEEFSG